MGLIAYGSFILSGNYLSQNLSLIIAIGIGALVYATIIYFMNEYCGRIEPIVRSFEPSFADI